MTLKSKYGWSREDMVRYIYGELKDEHISSLINNCIEKSDRDIIEILSDIRMTKAFRGFKTSNEHITTISREASLHTAKLAEKYGLELNEGKKINPNETNNPASIASSISKKAWIIIVIFASIIIVGGVMWFNQNRNVEPPIQEQQEKTKITPIASGKELATQYLKNEKPDLYPQTMGSEDNKEELGKAYRNNEYLIVIELLENSNNIKIADDKKALVLGISYNRLEESDKAISILEAINIESSYWDNAQWEIGVALLSQSDTDGAIQQFEALQNSTSDKKYIDLTKEIILQISSL